MRYLRMVVTSAAACALALTGVTAAQADDRDPGYRDSGSLTCGEGEVVRLQINYNGALEGKVNYNITRTNQDVVELPVARGGGKMADLTFSTQSQSSSWNIWMDTGGVAEGTADCVSRN